MLVNGNDFFEVYDGCSALPSVLAMARVIAVASLNARHIVLSAAIVGDGQRYRDPALAKARWEADDCIKNFERRCLKSGWLEQADFDAVQTKVDAMIEEAKQFAIDSPYPDASELFTDMYD